MLYKSSKVVFNWNKSRNCSGNICPKPDKLRNIHHPSYLQPPLPLLVKRLLFVSPLPPFWKSASHQLWQLFGWPWCRSGRYFYQASYLMIVVFFQDLDLWKQNQRNQRLNIGKSEPNEINIKSTILWISWKCGKGKLNSYDYELLLRSMMIAWAAWKGLHVAHPWHADSAGRNVVYICIHVYIIYQYIYI